MTSSCLGGRIRTPQPMPQGPGPAHHGLTVRVGSGVTRRLGRLMSKPAVAICTRAAPLHAPNPHHGGVVPPP